MELIVVLLLLGFLSGLIGIAIASNKKVDGAAGFFLGAFFGPIGWIITALLSPSSGTDTVNTGPSQPRTSAANGPPLVEADLQNAQYKVWLIEAYGISKNEVLGEFVCGKNTFKNIDDALHFVHSEEIAKRTLEKEVQREREVKRLAERERQLAIQAEKYSKDKRFAKWFGISLAGAILIASPFIYTLLRDLAEAQKARVAAREARASEILSKLGLEMREISDFESSKTNSEYSCDGQRVVEYTFHTSHEVVEKVRKIVYNARRHTDYSRNEGYISDILVNANPYFDKYFTVCEVGAELE